MKTTLMKTSLSFGFAWLLLASSVCFAGTVLNGSFENDYVNWSSQGNATIETSAFGGVNPTDGAKQALIRTNDGAGADETVSNLASLLFKIPEAQITALATDTAQAGSGLTQVITGVNVGDKLNFSWNYLTSEAAGITNNDFGFFSISTNAIGGPKTAMLLADTNAVTTPFSSAENYFSRQTGYSPMSYTFNVAGDYTIGFGIVNVTDTTFRSGLLIDSVSLTAVPEPTALAGLGLVGLALTLRRRRKEG
ncbi:MAG: PEP-CTERM sorting domain-containing protein [Planctomycetales bacterium]|nr:PEP-CTERM sorting domain-containing protein [Planctomycetales bacterium]MCA9209703.1 PEP-CTERM sorting domain-containing protein [Planctomycetales bacterium]